MDSICVFSNNAKQLSSKLKDGFHNKAFIRLNIWINVRSHYPVLACLCVLLGLSACKTNWFKDNEPQILFNAKLTLPAIPALDAKTPSPLTISFPLDRASAKAVKIHANENNDYQQSIPTHALRLQNHDIALHEKISITPHVEGIWTIDRDTIALQPNSHWPANVSYTLTFSNDLFMDNVARKEEEYKFTTRGLSVKATESYLYFDPTKPGEQRYVSTLQFSHPIDLNKLSDNYSISIPDTAKDTESLPFTITQDKNNRHQPNRVFHINSGQIELNSEVRFLTASVSGELRKTLFDHKVHPDNTSNDTPMLVNRVEVPSTDKLFHVEQTEVQVIRNEKDEPQKAVAVHFTSATSLGEIRKNLKLQLLPEIKKDEKRQWLTSAEQITPNMESNIEDIPFSVLPTVKPGSKTFILIFDAPPNHQMLVKIKKGMKAAAGYASSRNYAALHKTPMYPTELVFLGDGNVLDSNGSHQIGFASRNISTIHLKIGRINQSDLHHLISQTGGNFNETSFQGSLGIEDLAIVFDKTIAINNTVPSEKIYSSYDLTKHLSLRNESQGVFLVEAYGKNNKDHRTASTTRLVLVTDIGFIVKTNNDQSRDIFVQKISTKTPLGTAVVSILGRNGRAVFETSTDDQGHAVVPNLSSFDGEKVPIAILVTHGSDFVYLPTHKATHRMNYSRFETGGRHVDTADNNAINAFMFTDRGIYRPGESVNIAAIVRNNKIRTTKGFNVQFNISDPVGTNVYRKSHLLPTDGFLEINLDTSREFKTGVYTASLSINSRQENYKHLGSVTFSVEEFQPDRLKITTTVHNDILAARDDVGADKSSIDGWLTGEELKFDVSLRNLFGTAAQDRKITASFRTDRAPFTLTNYPGYHFSDSVTQQTPHNLQVQSELAVSNSDTAGHSTVKIDLETYFSGTYRVNLNTQGYEQNGGRSVHAEKTVRFSPREYLIGYKASGLNYLKSDQLHAIDLLCVSKYAKARNCPMQLNVMEISHVSTLIKQDNGTYQYQTIEKKTEHSSNNIVIESTGYSHQLDTGKPGTYSLELLDGQGEVRHTITYTVIGDHNPTTNLETDARLELSLDKSQYQKGEWIELQIKAPYVGSGLISIESDHTHAFKWFNTTSKQSVQKIQVPDDLQGNAYVQVAFIRSPTSDEIFTAPLSYAVAPFDLSKDQYKMELTLLTPDLVKPGDTLKISYRSSEPGRSLIIAVDEGILQAADYVNPDPLAFFLQKRALQVETHQMFDLLLPEFELLQKRSASGGDMDASTIASTGNNLNPFARQTQTPVVFWSGIMPTDKETRSVEFTVPDHFDGNIRVMSIALNERQFAKASNNVIVKGPFIVTPSLPLVVAPGDTFVASVSVSNQITDSADNTLVNLIIDTGTSFEVIGETTQSKIIREGDEHTFNFTLKATDHLGSAEISFSAQTNNQSTDAILSLNATSRNMTGRNVTNTVSIRPATLLKNTLHTGKSNSTTTIIQPDRKLFKTHSTVTINASFSPTLLIDGLISYLEVSAHACTEQIVSKLSPVLAYHDHPNILGDPSVKQQQIDTLFATLRARQLPNGGFSLWPGQAHAAELPSVHALHVLIDAIDSGIIVPGALIENGEDYLREFAYDPANMQQRPELSAYALYLLTRRGEITNNALIQLQSILQDKQSAEATEQWHGQLVAAYMAASFKILRRDDDALHLINQYQFKNTRKNIDHYDTALYRDAMAIYLLARHFETEFKKDDVHRIEAIIEPIRKGAINTLSSGRALIALKAYGEIADNRAANVTVESTKSYSKNAKTTNWSPIGFSSNAATTPGKSARIDHDTAALKLISNDAVYYQLVQAGFDIEPPIVAKTAGLEITKQILNADGKPLSDKPTQGQDVLVQIKARSLDNIAHPAVAIVDLLPGGFEIDRQSVRDYQNYDADYIDIREDRLVVYTSIGPSTIEISYRARLTTSGEFTVPAVYTNAMYNEKVYAHSTASSLNIQAGL